MRLENQRVLVTGASGGIGSALTTELTARGARLCLLARSLPDALEPDTVELAHGSRAPLVLRCDIADAAQRDAAWHAVERAWGGVDILINLAGVLDFTPFQQQDPAVLHRLLAINLEAPMQLCRAALPGMIAQRYGRIVNVGSMFGSIAFPCFASYSATKFALRGFSQALRRELAGSGVGVAYVSPRAVRTAMNPPVVHEMAALGMMQMDEPAEVARGIVRAIERERDETYLGFPESLFARLNGVLPGLVDRALHRQLPALLKFATQGRR